MVTVISSMNGSGLVLFETLTRIKWRIQRENDNNKDKRIIRLLEYKTWSLECNYTPYLIAFC